MQVVPPPPPPAFPARTKVMDPQVLIVLLPFFLFHIFSTIFIANPLKQDFFVNRCHHYQVLARINKNSALSVSLSRPQWKYCMKKINKKKLYIAIFPSFNQQKCHTSPLFHHATTHPHTKFLWRDHILLFWNCSLNISE